MATIGAGTGSKNAVFIQKTGFLKNTAKKRFIEKNIDFLKMLHLDGVISYPENNRF